MKDKPSAYEQITREKVIELSKKIDGLQEQFKLFDIKTTEMFNHLSSRLPIWATALITSLVSILTGVAVYALTK